MKLVTFSIEESRLRIGALINDSTVIDIAAAADEFGISGPFANVVDVLTDPDGLQRVKSVVESAAERPGPWNLALEEIRLAAPIARPGKILGAALNYHCFCERGNLEVPTALKVFTKVSTTVVGPNDAVIVPPERKVTYEGELAVVIGKRGRQIMAADAFDHVAGYTIVNDFTANDLIKEDVQLMRGKNLDTFCPMGPAIVTKDEIPDPGRLSVMTQVNGIIRQRSNTEKLIFDIPSMIEYFSSFLTLEPGDVIATGTPAGTALQCDPPAFMERGDTVAVTVEGLGTLTNTIE